MVLDNYVASGKGIKDLPIKVVCFKEDIDLVENYISNKTSWQLIEHFKESKPSKDMKYKFIDCLTIFRKKYGFDLLVIRNISEINNPDILAQAYAIDDLYVAPVYCMDTEEVIYFLPEDIEQNMFDICSIRNEGYHI